MLYVRSRFSWAKGWMLVNQDRFPDGTLRMTAPKDPRFTDCDVDIYWKYDNDAELFSLICLRKHYADCKNVTLYMPYCPHARMDRVKSANDVFTLKSFAGIINSLNFSKAVVYDAHSNVSLALIDRVENRDNTSFVERAINKINDPDLVMYYPDEGAMKRYSEQFNRPYSFGMKKRDWATGNINGIDIINKEAVRDKNILIVDDICSRGGTFFHSAKALKAEGAKNIYLFITHCEATILEGELIKSGLIEHIFTTNSLADNFPTNLITVDPIIL